MHSDLINAELIATWMLTFVTILLAWVTYENLKDERRAHMRDVATLKPCRKLFGKCLKRHTHEPHPIVREFEPTL